MSTPNHLDQGGAQDDEVDSLFALLSEAQEDPTISISAANDAAVPPPNLQLRLDQQQQHYHFPSVGSTVAIRQLPSQGLSFQLWPAATTLVALLERHRRDPAASPLSAAFSSDGADELHRGRLRVLELGSGTGLVGIAAAAILGAEVTVTDLPHVLPNLRFNAEANSKELIAHGGSVRVAALRWGEAGDADAIGREFDVILGSDVVYHDHLYEPLLQTLRFLLVGGAGGERRESEGEAESGAFVMAHLRRWKKEASFFKKARKLFEVRQLHADEPAPGSRLGVVVYSFTRKRRCFNSRRKNSLPGN